MITYFLGALIGLTLGLTGAGGSVFAVPLLIYVIGVTPQEAIGISLAAVSLCALYGTVMRLRSGHILWLPGIVFASVGSLFSPLGNWLNQFIPPSILLPSFAVLMTWIAWRMWHQARQQPELSQIVRGRRIRHEAAPSQPICVLNDNQPFRIGPKCLSGIILAAIVTGLLSGLFGVGGGFIIVPALLALIRIKMIEAVATSLFVITLVSGFGFLGYVMQQPIQAVDLFIEIIIGGAVGMTIGIVFSQKLAGPKLQRTFSILMWLTAAWIFTRSFVL